MAVILRKDNWTEIFEPVFMNREGFHVGLQRLNAVRRPAMHSRPVDAVQICEVTFTVARLNNLMEYDFKGGAASSHERTFLPGIRTISERSSALWYHACIIRDPGEKAVF